VRQAFTKLAEGEGWQVYHTPKNLAAAVAVESGELLEIFQWLNDEQASEIIHDPVTQERVADEVADVVMYLVELCAHLNIDMAEAVAQKIDKNRRRLELKHEAY